ncbi:uncharacterized protein EAE98_011724 [Botrytis deweyae]|uniref:37S ribosomal protein S25, mitochondrial n=1 Tax=Botrytis deweyae TaxID=2478750 RepID=A0ABQ7I4X3_9HELO|nr:uncharacterized protein EAE98_011724 [Botrytis deweyae]KAF7911967.1 hypothetical protein EAE98_011724 [Botrytis deweyae]
MSSLPPKPTLKVLEQFNQGKEAGKQAFREDRVEKLFEFQHPEEYLEGYKAGVKAEKNLGIRGTEEWKADMIAKEAKKAKEHELFKAAGERKVKEARRIEEAIETAHRDAVMFHREFDKSQGASEEELKETFGMDMNFADMGNVLEIHGPRAQLDKDGQIQGGLEREESRYTK